MESYFCYKSRVNNLEKDYLIWKKSLKFQQENILNKL